MKKRSTIGLILDFILVICTGGLWLIWILIRFKKPLILKETRVQNVGIKIAFQVLTYTSL